MSDLRFLTEYKDFGTAGLGSTFSIKVTEKSPNNQFSCFVKRYYQFQKLETWHHPVISPGPRTLVLDKPGNYLFSLELVFLGSGTISVEVEASIDGETFKKLVDSSMGLNHEFKFTVQIS